MGKYIVTGVAGFIGSRVAEMLLDEGHHVIGLDNLNSAYDVRMKEWRLGRIKNRSNFSFCLLDISKRDELAKLLAGQPNSAVDAVINLAARAGVRQSVLDPVSYYETNLMGTLNLLEMCRQHEIGKFILASTSSIYGSNAPLPTPEIASSDRPLQPYAASKKAAEVLCHSFHFLHGLDVTIFRFFTVYGPAGRPDMSLFRFTQWIREGRTLKLLGTGEQSRGFTYIDDIARGTIGGLKSMGYEIINLGGHETIKMIDLIRALEEKIGKKANIEYHPVDPADMMANWADVSKANSLLAWQPQVGLDEGLTNLVQWYEQERDWASQIQT